eukprot:NODE_18449_length_893_cov_1.969974.p2 GENE.NODE_18449_length_893_cov_1.969974~~NODE_18449_length_893_cov_1.969974.p2  ORF type:complete len:249 (-),score=77.71 NODE_18449_length_893_cov_1.969974:78-824(-)
MATSGARLVGVLALCTATYAAWTTEEKAFLDSQLASTNFCSTVNGSHLVFQFLTYFPGNKIYGADRWGNATVDGKQVSWFLSDVPGNMVQTSYRRMQVGTYCWQNDQAKPFPTDFSGSWLFTIGGSPDPKVYVSKRWNFQHMSGQWSDSAEDDGIRVARTTEKYNGTTVQKIVVTDPTENACYQQTRNIKACAEKSSCVACPVEAALHSECRQDNNIIDVARYWCICSNESDCGGQPEYDAATLELLV